MLIIIAIVVILSAGAYLLWLLAFNIVVACMIGIVVVAFLVALPVIHVRNEITEARKASRSKKFVDLVKDIKDKLKADSDQRDGVPPAQAATLRTEGTPRSSLIAKMRRIERLERSRK